ncbi:hypothetical protein BCR34DRAFT_192531 [Clohesyomyces aquaticus]|uniref:Uncharacterized protein n=1 Tax=Clohesyomyces aquaticus TaxID=1231657 RepID=A0A1Y1ZYT5_9PLEO|nr:hypothetical protein BCR34DRAFT_192531 [Clohesyomyces aquaticus]
MLDTLDLFVTNVKGKQSLWHLVDHVDIKGDFPLLRHNLVVVDGLGSDDTNRERTSRTRRWKDKCGVQLNIAGTVHIKSQPQVIEKAIRAIHKKSAEKVILVATKTNVSLITLYLVMESLIPVGHYRVGLLPRSRSVLRPRSRGAEGS